jgi:transcriptional regulator with XRE-family HTH domain
VSASLPIFVDERKYAAELGAWMRRKREARGLNQDEIAEVVGVSRCSVSRWETGRSMPSAYQLHLLRSFLKVRA